MAPVPAQEKLLQIHLHLRPTAMSVFRTVLPDKVLLSFCRQHGVTFRHRFFTPLLTFWAFVAQCLEPDHSCRTAVAYALLWWRGRKAPGQRRNRPVAEHSNDTGAYCKARARLPETLIPAMSRHVGRTLDQRVGESEKLWGRDVYLADGTCLSMPDTPQLTQAFGKSSGGRRGAKTSVFPIARAVALISLYTGAVVEAAVGAYKTSEHVLFHGLWKGAEWLRGAVLVGDRLYGSFAHLALLSQQGTDVISRLHGRRPTDLRQGKSLGPGDRLVIWHRVGPWPPWLAPEANLPETLSLRLIRVRSRLRGFRPKEIFLVTTLLDPKCYKAQDIANLYLRRWEMEVDLRHMKSVLQLDVFRGKSPDIVRKEFWTHLVVYNLVRSVMWEAAASHALSPSGLEFQRHAPAPQYLRTQHRRRPLFTLGPQTPQGAAA